MFFVGLSSKANFYGDLSDISRPPRRKRHIIIEEKGRGMNNISLKC